VSESARPLDPLPCGAPGLDAAALAIGVRRGDPAAFDAFYAAYFDRLFRFLLVLSHGHEDLARDALQETLVRVLRHVRPLPDEQALWRWLARVARTALVDLLRKTRGRARVRLDARLDATAASDDEFADRALRESLSRALASLPADERALVEAHYLRGRAQRDLALEHDTTRKAVETRIARIRQKLRALLLDDLGEGGGR
jgi:RNA polymerase sigma-70 factor (ECF subfamily)